MKKAKLNPKDVRRIRRLRKDGMSYRAIAHEYEMAHQTISDIIHGKLWSSVS